MKRLRSVSDGNGLGGGVSGENPGILVSAFGQSFAKSGVDMIMILFRAWNCRLASNYSQLAMRRSLSRLFSLPSLSPWGTLAQPA